MKLYYATGTCSLSPHIVALEAGLPLELERVDITTRPHLTEGGRDYASVNPNGYVPALVLDDGATLTEGAAIVQALGDLRPESGLVPLPGTPARTQLQIWLNFIATELHKSYSPWLFHPEVGAAAQAFARAKSAERLAYVEGHLAAKGPFLLGANFTAADAYLFTIVSWSGFAKVDLTAFPSLRAFIGRVGERPMIRAAIAAERPRQAA